MLKETALSITSLVTDLFNISIRLSELPDEWKISRVSPIPKPGNHSDFACYCPISLLTILSELLEKHIQNILVRHFKEHHPISTRRWEFTHLPELYWMQLTIGPESWNRDMTSALCSLTTVKCLIQFHTGFCC